MSVGLGIEVPLCYGNFVLCMQHMWNQEKAHLEFFSTLVKERRVRPTVLLPLWDIAGFVLGNACV